MVRWKDLTENEWKKQPMSRGKTLKDPQKTCRITSQHRLQKNLIWLLGSKA